MIRQIILNLETSTFHGMGSYEKWQDFEKNLERTNQETLFYTIKDYYPNGPLLQRKDKGNKVTFEYAFTIKRKEEIDEAIEKGLLAKLHPDTKKAVTVN